jgi:hypothetical protein
MKPILITETGSFFQGTGAIGGSKTVQETHRSIALMGLAKN